MTRDKVNSLLIAAAMIFPFVADHSGSWAAVLGTGQLSTVVLTIYTLALIVIVASLAGAMADDDLANSIVPVIPADTDLETCDGEGCDEQGIGEFPLSPSPSPSPSDHDLIPVLLARIGPSQPQPIQYPQPASWWPSCC